MKQQKPHLRYASLLAMALTASTAAWAQTPIPASFGHPRASVDTGTRGFSVRVVQASQDAGTLENTNVRAEAQLAGTLLNPLTGIPFANVADTSSFDPDGTYHEAASIDYEVSGGASGPIPGIDSGGSNHENIALEAFTYLDLDPGTYTMIVNSDDGFRVSASPDPRDQITSVQLGEFIGGRSADDTSFSFSISAAGVYGFRLLYEQGGGGGSVSWYAALSTVDDPHVLINSTEDIKAYRALTGGQAPYVSVANPQPGSTNVVPSTSINFAIGDGTTAKVVPASVSLTFDGVKTTSAATKTGSRTTISYQPPARLPFASEHTVKLIFNDDSTPVKSRTNEYTFKVAAYIDLKLPPPIYLETFDEVAEGELPAGWTQVNFTDSLGDPELPPVFDLNDPHSDSYLGWTTISSNRMWFIGEGALTPEAKTNDPVLGVPENSQWEALRRFTVGEQYVNGVLVTSLVTNNFAYAESDTRGRNQVQYLFTKDYNLTGKTNVYLSYHSMYEQNQDSMGSAEYSVDGGTNWLPLVIMIDKVDIKFDTDGKVLGYETLIEPQGDTAIIHDEDGNDIGGGYYGAFLGNQDTNTWAALGPFISARINDDRVESKRVELFRMPKADNAKTVRVRFAQAGTGSWYFGIDDVGFYSITDQVAAPIAITKPTVGASGITLAWTGGTGPFLVQGKLGLTDAWIDLVTTADHTATIPLAGFSGFFRIVDGTTKTVKLFKASLKGANERPTPVTTPGTGTGLLALDGLTATYVVSYQNLTSPPQAYHLHGLGTTEQAVPVLFGIVPVGTPTQASGLFAGQQTLTQAQADGVVAGLTYFNVHTTANGGGEIRGQVLP